MLPGNRLITLLAVILLTMTSIAHSKDNLSVKQFELALGACEQGINGELPLSRGALRVLRNQIQKYERYRDKAAKRSPDILQSLDLTYEGNESGFGTISFQDAYQICERQLPERLTEAESSVKKMMEKREQRRDTRQHALAVRQQKIDAAMVHVKQALDTLCVPNMTAEEVSSDPEILLQYKAEQKQAIESYADIGQQFYSVIMVNTFTSETETQRRQIKAWFKMCDELLNSGTMTDEVDTKELVPEADAGLIGPFPPSEEGPMLPPATRSSVKDEMPQEIPVGSDESSVKADSTDSLDEEIAREFNSALQRMKGDRRAVLSSEGRLPDYTNSEDDDTLKASIWQYEKYDEVASSCHVYTFQQNTIQSEKQLDSECPPLF